MTKRFRPQVVTMGLLDRSSSVVQHGDGLAATCTIMAESPTPIVFAMDSTYAASVGAPQQLLAAGALATLNRRCRATYRCRS